MSSRNWASDGDGSHMTSQRQAFEPALDFTGRTVLVTGSGRNIGKAILLEFAARGANVIVNVKGNRNEAEQARKEAEELGAKALVVIGDASERSVVQEIKRQAEEVFGRVDIYVSCANRRLSKDFFATTDEDWHYYLNQQLTASWYLAKAFVPSMKDAGFGRIVHLSGPDGFHGMASRIPAATGKGGLRVLTKSLAEGLGRYGITVNDINPGFAETVRDYSTHPELEDQALVQRIIAEIPIRRQTRLKEVAFACAFLCSPLAGAITGNTIHLDGGHKMLG